jgi:hypothetical protein
MVTGTSHVYSAFVLPLTLYLPVICSHIPVTCVGVLIFNQLSLQDFVLLV